jgi:hypothetical protein
MIREPFLRLECMFFHRAFGAIAATENSEGVDGNFRIKWW